MRLNKILCISIMSPNKFGWSADNSSTERQLKMSLPFTENSQANIDFRKVQLCIIREENCEYVYKKQIHTNTCKKLRIKKVIVTMTNSINTYRK